jgi:hypothetical protein
LPLEKGFLRVVYAAGALLLFILALEVLRAAAGGVADVLSGVSAQGSANIFGFGWLGAYGALSGSPVAAIALSLFAGGTISDSEAFAMLNGSRMGASFIVLFIGFLYYVSKRRTADGIFIGVVALLTTFTVYAPVVPLGSLVLEQGWLDGVEVSAPGFLVSFTDVAFGPLADEATRRRHRAAAGELRHLRPRAAQPGAAQPTRGTHLTPAASAAGDVPAGVAHYDDDALRLDLSHPPHPAIVEGVRSPGRHHPLRDGREHLYLGGHDVRRAPP